MTKSVVEWMFENLPEHFKAISPETIKQAKDIEQRNIKEAFNAGNNDNYYDTSGKAAENYWRVNYDV